jgi:DNA-directed RNA polymerase specialized sigma24 family protein
VRAGNDAAVQSLHRWVYDTLLAVARGKLNGRAPGWADEEDVALSAFRSFCQRAADGQFPALKERQEVRRLLITITSRKANALLRHHNRKRRRPKTSEDFGQGTRGGLEDLPGKDQPPELAVVIAEECQRLLDQLDEPLQQIAIMKMEGYTDGEIAEKLGVVTRTVERKMARIRAKWEAEERKNET